MGRELRKVPANWAHPKKDDGRYQPMHESGYMEAITEWIKDHNLWLEGKHPDQKRNGNKKYKFYAEYAGNPPSVEFYNTFYDPKDPICTHYMLYESTSEGTPKSPAFATIDEVAEYAEKNCTTFATFTATKEQWLSMLTDGMVHHTEGNITFI